MTGKAPTPSGADSITPRLPPAMTRLLVFLVTNPSLPTTLNHSPSLRILHGLLIGRGERQWPKRSSYGIEQTETLLRSILGEESGKCNIDMESLTSHFNIPAVPLGEDTPGWLQDTTETTSDEEDHSLTYPMEIEEVESQLKRLPLQSAPGPDGVDYRLWKSTPGGAALLTRLYNTCLLNRKFPNSWKKSNTILIYKRGMSFCRTTGDRSLYNQLFIRSSQQ